MFKALLITCLILGHFIAYASVKSIYGEDNRHPILEESALRQEIGKSVAAQVMMSRYLREDFNGFVFRTDSIINVFNFCPDEKFSQQPILSDCSGFLVADDIVMTAGHCMQNKSDCSQKFWVFDYDHQASLYKNEDEVVIPKDKVYSCQSVIAYANEKVGNAFIDYALVKLNRKVSDRKPLSLKRLPIPKVSANLAVIGHPLGMPKILADQITPSADFKAANQNIEADTFSGNSGSPLIDLNSGNVVGMLIRGELDFKYDYEIGCNRALRCSNGSCKGETILNFGQFPFKQIPFRF